MMSRPKTILLTILGRNGERKPRMKKATAIVDYVKWSVIDELLKRSCK